MSSPLTSQQEEVLVNFQDKCSQEGLLSRPAGLGTNVCTDGINDETALLRFLAARKFNVEQALIHFREAYQVRNTTRLCEFYERVDIDSYQRTASFYPQWSGRLDKRGQPICYFELSKLDGQAVSTHNESARSNSWLDECPTNPEATPDHILHAYAVHDCLTRFVMQLCSAVAQKKDPGIQITKQLVVADISGLGIKKTWQLKGFILDFNRLLTLNYPEILDRVLVIGAPRYISTIWAWVQNWVDPGTAAKLQIVAPGEVHSTLTSFIHLKDIPERYGGRLQYEVGTDPVLDVELCQVLGWPSGSENRLPNGPMHWVDDPAGSKVAVAVGSIGGKRRYERFATLFPDKT